MNNKNETIKNEIPEDTITENVEETTEFSEKLEDLTENIENTAEPVEKDKPKKDKKKKGFSLKTFFKSRSTKRGSLSIAIIAVFITLVILLNTGLILLVEKVPALSWDITSNQIYEMQEDTIEYIKKVKDEVTIYVFMEEEAFSKSTDPVYQQSGRLLKQFNQYNEKIAIKYIDLNSNPTFTTKYTNIDFNTSASICLVESGSDYKDISFYDFFSLSEDMSSLTGQNVEQTVTSAILNVTNKNKVKYALITGLSDTSYAEGIESVLGDNGYEKEEINLNTQDIPLTCKFVLLYAPTVDLSLEAADRLSSFLENSGKYGKSMIYMPYIENIETPNLDNILKIYGLEVTKDVVYETDFTRLTDSGNYFMFIPNYSNSFTDNLKNKGVPLIMLNPLNINVLDSNIAAPMLSTSEKAGLIPLDYSSDEIYDFEGNIAEKELNVAAYGSQQDESGNASSVIVLGSPDAFTSSVFAATSYNNLNYFVNVCNTVSDKGNTAVVNITSKSTDTEQIVVTEATGMFINIFFMWILPIAVLAMGLAMYLVRKNK